MEHGGRTVQEERRLDYANATHRAFRAMGLDEVDAWDLTLSGATPSELKRLLNRGCSMKLALEILK